MQVWPGKVAPKGREWIFEVRHMGRLPCTGFPGDMLRYDEARITRRNDGGSYELRSPRYPTVKRWESFGWTLFSEPRLSPKAT